MLKKFLTIASFPAFLLVARFVPFERLPGLCGFYLLTGYPCPACGMTRSVIALTHLDFLRAVHMNPLGILAVGIFGLWWATASCELTRGHTTRFHLWASRHAYLLTFVGIGVLFLFGILRILILTRH